MKTYDLYLFAKEKAVIVGWHRFDASQDSEALGIAENLVSQPPAELWQGGSLVKHWDSAAHPATSPPIS